MTAVVSTIRARYFTAAERMTQPPVRSNEVEPSPSMYDELLHVPVWWTPDGLTLEPSS